ncbi:hypothetical protein ACRALDRAFT_2038997 [Sodiomyces alcalophilus JCM 7366]|uniref:uncharacterized protein n=1 Tax=Sodiomyces alcalophilus JCM 7366 TaxID=591952 RepID=UPI0039B58DA1
MALISASYIVIFPFIMFFTIPLAILAGVTTTISFAILMFRLLLVYVQLFMSLLPSCLTPIRHSWHAPYGPVSLPPSPISSLGSSPPGESAPVSSVPLLTNASRSLSLNRIPQRRRPRSRRLSSTSAAGRDVSAPPLASENGGNVGLIPSIGIGRDFEGIGGWRLGCDDETDDERWAMINSRLEFFDRMHQGARHHRRASSGGTDGGLTMKGRRRSRRPHSVVNSPASVRSVARVSPNSSRARMPGVSYSDRAPTEDDGEYFPAVTTI